MSKPTLEQLIQQSAYVWTLGWVFCKLTPGQLNELQRAVTVERIEHYSEESDTLFIYRCKSAPYDSVITLTLVHDEITINVDRQDQ